MYDETVTYQDLKVVLAAEPSPTAPLNRPILLDGRTVGSWSRTRKARSAVTLEASLFTPLTPAEEEALRSAVDAFGRFLGRSARLVAAPAVS